MPELKIQEAKLLFKKIHTRPKLYDLQIVDGVITGNDDKISFKLYKKGEQNIFEVIIDETLFTNSTGEWNNAIIMLENTIRKIEKEKEMQKIEDARNKLKDYLSEEKNEKK
ncbi:MAG: hypothetical protein QM564_09475 [Bergeyella sp.]